MLNVETPVSGRVVWNGSDVATLDEDARKRFRSSVQAVFQDPYSSMNPRMRVEQFITEPLLLNASLGRSELRERAEEALAQVGLRAGDVRNFPHEFSGGQRQRVAIARALASAPELIVLDEPVSSLDVSIRAQIMNLLKDLQENKGFSYLFIAHHLGNGALHEPLGRGYVSGADDGIVGVGRAVQESAASVHAGAVFRRLAG